MPNYCPATRTSLAGLGPLASLSDSLLLLPTRSLSGCPGLAGTNGPQPECWALALGIARSLAVAVALWQARGAVRKKQPRGGRRRRLAWPLRKDDTLSTRWVSPLFFFFFAKIGPPPPHLLHSPTTSSTHQPLHRDGDGTALHGTQPETDPLPPPADARVTPSPQGSAHCSGGPGGVSPGCPQPERHPTPGP